MKRSLKYILYLVLAVLLFIPLFGQLDTLPLRLWDESRLALNALEMYENGPSIVTTIDGEQDLWNTKPPLLVWIQSGLMHLLGPGIMAIRLPSAIAGLLTCILVFLFGKRVSGSEAAGVLAGLVLVTINGYIHYHGTRNGDYDALLVLFMCTSLFCFYLYSRSQKKILLYGFFLFLALSVLTKGVAGLLFLPGLGIYCAVRYKKLFQLLRNPHFYIGFAGFLLLVGGYYFAREQVAGGYLEAVYMNELGGRYLESIEGHRHPWHYYFENLYESRFRYWLWFLPAAILHPFFLPKGQQREALVFLWFNVFTYLLIVSFSSTKLEWYDLPVFPLLAVILGIFLFAILRFVSEAIASEGGLKREAVFVSSAIVLMAFPYFKIVEKTTNPVDAPWEVDTHGAGHFLNAALKKQVKPDTYTLMEQGYNAHFWFYQRVLNKYRDGFNVRLMPYKEVSPGETVLACRKEAVEYIDVHFDFEYLGKNNRCHVYRLIEKK